MQIYSIQPEEQQPIYNYLQGLARKHDDKDLSGSKKLPSYLSVHDLTAKSGEKLGINLTPRGAAPHALFVDRVEVLQKAYELLRARDVNSNGKIDKTEHLSEPLLVEGRYIVEHYSSEVEVLSRLNTLGDQSTKSQIEMGGYYDKSFNLYIDQNERKSHVYSMDEKTWPNPSLISFHTHPKLPSGEYNIFVGDYADIQGNRNSIPSEPDILIFLSSPKQKDIVVVNGASIVLEKKPNCIKRTDFDQNFENFWRRNPEDASHFAQDPGLGQNMLRFVYFYYYLVKVYPSQHPSEKQFSHYNSQTFRNLLENVFGISVTLYNPKAEKMSDTQIKELYPQKTVGAAEKYQIELSRLKMMSNLDLLR
jgi:hypothetical protein